MLRKRSLAMVEKSDSKEVSALTDVDLELERSHCVYLGLCICRLKHIILANSSLCPLPGLLTVPMVAS